MEFSDQVYGDIKVEDQIIIDLINSKAFQRLKEINQYGGVNLVYPDRFQVSRFEHSIGVWWVLKNLNVPLEVQVAGLLHDIGHCAFSHMVDMAMEDKGEDFHERFAYLIQGKKEIDKILAANNIILKRVDEYPEIKKSLPDVGADRIDYGLRDYIYSVHDEISFGVEVLNSITLTDSGIVFTNLEVARKYALMGVEAMWNVIYAPEVAVIYQALIEMIRDGMNEGWLTTEDLFTNDKNVLEIFKKNGKNLDPKYLNLFLKAFRVEQVTSDSTYDFKHVKLKVRYFDPYVLIDGQQKKVSEVDEEFNQKIKQWVEKFERRIEGEYFSVIYEQ